MEEVRLPLEHLVYPEAALLEALGIEKTLLDDLRRDKGFPFVRLDARHRVYLSDEVVGWLKKQVIKQ